MEKEAQAGDSSKLLVVQQHIPGCGRQWGAGGTSRAASHSSRAAFAWQTVSSFQLQAARWWLLSPCHHSQSQQQATPSSPRPWKKMVAGALCKSKYLCSQGLPSPALYFLPFLKCHRSAVSIIVQEMSSLLAGSLTLKSAGSAVAAPLTSAAGPCIHPESSEDMARREMGQSGTWPQSCLWLWQSFSH